MQQQDQGRLLERNWKALPPWMLQLHLLRQAFWQQSVLPGRRIALLRSWLEWAVYHEMLCMWIPSRGWRSLGGGPKQQLSQSVLQLHDVQEESWGSKLLCERRSPVLQKSRALRSYALDHRKWSMEWWEKKNRKSKIMKRKSNENKKRTNYFIVITFFFFFVSWSKSFH